MLLPADMDYEDRERLAAYSSVHAHTLDELMVVGLVLRDDVSRLMDSDWNDGMFRRAYIRAAWAHIEGITYAIRRFVHVALVLGSAWEVGRNSGVYKLLEETVIAVTPAGGAKIVRRRFPDTLTAVKQTLLLIKKVEMLDWSPDFNGPVLKDLKASLDLRHRLT